MSKQTSFNLQWLADPSFSQWVAKHPTNSHKAKCVPYGKNIELGNMGRKALSSHAAGDKHKARLKSLLKGKQEQQSLKMLWNSDACVAASSADAISRCENQEEKVASLADQLTIPEPPQGKPPGQLSEAKDRQNNLASFMLKDSVLEAEIVGQSRQSWIITLAHPAATQTNCFNGCSQTLKLLKSSPVEKQSVHTW